MAVTSPFTVRTYAQSDGRNGGKGKASHVYLFHENEVNTLALERKDRG